MIRLTPAFALFVALTLAGCDSKHSHSNSALHPTQSARAGSSDASAQQVAKEGRAGLDCPAKARSSPRPGDAPVDDVLGVRPGMNYEEATETVLCSNELLVLQTELGRGFNINTHGQKLRQGFAAQFAEARVQKTSKQIMQEMQDSALARSGNRVAPGMPAGQAKWYVGTMGLTDKEAVVNVAREEAFADGRNPTMTSVEQALISKYGKPTRLQHTGGQSYLTWAYDPSGRPITETSPLFNRCTGSASPDGGVSLSPDCGIVAAAILIPMRDNPELARSMQVGVVDQAGGFARITATEAALEKGEIDRRAQQVKDATKNADAPKL